MRLPLQTSLVRYNQISWDTVVVPPIGKQIHVYEARVHNGSAGASALGILKRLSPGGYDLYSVTQLSTPDAALNNGVKAGTTTQIFSLVANDGLMIQCVSRFDLIGFNIVGASAGGVYQIEYYNGTTFAVVASAVIPVLSSAGQVVFSFQAPHDWVQGTTAGVGGDATKYSIIIRATTNPTTAVTANAMILAKFLDFTVSAPAQGSLVNTFFAFQPLVLAGEEGIQPYFGSAAVTNIVRVTYSIQE